MRNEESKQEFETARVVDELVEFTTWLTPGRYVREVAKFEVGEMKRITRNDTNITIPTIEQMSAYLTALLDLRVRLVNNEQLHSKGNYIKQFLVPARWFVLLSQIGEATDNTRRFRFTPEVDYVLTPAVEEVRDEDGKVITEAVKEVRIKILSLDEMLKISYLLSVVVDEGYVAIAGIPRDVEGSLPFMTKTSINNVIRSLEKDSPVYAFMAFILENEIAAESYDDIELIARIKYSSFDTYMSAFRSYFVQAATSK